MGQDLLERAVTVEVVDVFVLGPLEVRRAGRPVTVRGAKARAVLTMLGLNVGQVVRGEVLGEMLWGDEEPRTAHKALLTYVSQLRRALGSGLVRTSGSGWVLTSATTDATAFEASCRAGRDAMRNGSAAAAAAHFADASSTWRGLPELPATPRGRAELTRWGEAYQSLVDDRVDALLECGRSAELVGELETAVAETPLRERRWAQLCLALYRAGRQADALHTYHRARAVLSDELGVEPGPGLRRLEAAILRQEAGLEGPSRARHPPAHRGGTDLPIPPTTIVGRRAELARLGELLAQHRVVTATGPGGVGKTRLALAAAEATASAFPAGVWFVDLAPVESAYVVEAVAGAVGVRGHPERGLEDAVHAHLGAGRSLLLMDSCEHLVDAASAFVGRLAACCPEVVVLATSREPLRVAGEQVFAVPPLSLAEPEVAVSAASAEGSDATTLFVQRARAVEPDFDADPELIGEVCARCDGLPLAIELAAARCGSLGVDGLLAGLDDRIRLLVGARVTPARHRSLRAVLDWSHHLLDAEEQALFRRVSAFAGSFDLAAAAVVADRPDTVVVDLVGRLTDKSLLIRRRGPTGSRWRMLDVVRSYARERLTTSGEKAAVREGHLAWAETTAVELERRLDSGRAWAEEFDLVADDLRAALPVSGDAGQRLALGLALARLYARRGAFTFAQAVYEDAMAVARGTGDADQLARAALGASMQGMLFGVTQSRRVALLEEALVAQGPEPTPIRARLLARLATELYWSPDRDRSRDLAADASAVAEHAEDDGARAHALYAVQYVARGPANWAERVALTERVIGLAERSGETQLELAGRAAHAVALMEAGDLPRMDAEVTVLSAAADRLQHPEFQWYTAVYRLVGALAAGRFNEADALAAAATEAARHAPEFPVGLFFAEAVTDLRRLSERRARRRSERLAEMAEENPRVVVWRCLAALDDIAQGRTAGAGARIRTLSRELLSQSRRDGHWLVGSSLLAEAAAALADEDLAGPIAQALRPFAGRVAVAGRVGAFRGSVSYALGVLAATVGETDQAEDDLAASVRQHERMGAHPYLARSLEALAQVRAARPIATGRE